MALTTPPRAVIGTPYRPYRRGVENAILGGVCGGLAIRLGVKERTVRILFSLLALVGGLGVFLYMVLWLTRPRSGEDEAIGHRLLGRRRELHRVLIGLIAIFACLFVLVSLGLPNIGVYTWPLLLSLIAAFGVWRGASSDERRHLEDLVKSAPIIGAPAARTRRSLWLRVILGVLLVFIGLRTLRHVNGYWGGTTPIFYGIILLVAGVLVLLAPWWLATLNDLSGERRARVRVEERANVAAHLHDSVLQTLTLIERAAGDETAVTRLARNQERELRQWLFEPDRDVQGGEGSTFTSQLHVLESEIENDYGVKVELVVVGDCASDDDVLALVAAGREAAINAARWSEATSISIFAEVEPDTVTLYVRDRGKGFDVDAVPHDRRGIALSIRQRMQQHGGSASLKSALEVGTEVQLCLPRKA
jgi:signal transduction histidine kinase/phage shock protein PspC (stress-responsive transcriptional regulator)